MRELLSTGEALSKRPLRAFLCLLLAVTFLYNPFFVAVASQVFPSVSHLPSYRANVASSELLKFKSNVEIAVAFVVEQDMAAVVLPASAPARTGSYEQPTDERVTHQVLGIANIWFRPPPVA